MKTFARVVLLAALALIVGIISMVPDACDDQGWHPSGHYTERQELFEQMPLDGDTVVMVGDSLTELCGCNGSFSNLGVANLGIAGDTVKGVLNRLDTVTRARPRKVFLMIGINDLTDQRKAGDLSAILDDYEEILLLIHEQSPATQTYVQSVLPFNTDITGTKFDNDVIVAFNSELRNMTERIGNGVCYLDLYSRFADNGQLNSLYTDDGVHLNGNGCSLWREIIGDLLG